MVSETADSVQQLNKMRDDNKIQSMLKKPFAAALAAMVCCMLWGSAFPFIKIGYKLFDIASDDAMSQILFAGIRFLFAGMLVIIFGSAVSKKVLVPKKESLPKVCLLSLFQTVLQYLFFYIGLANTSGTRGSIINSTSTFFALLFSCLIFKQEKLNIQKIIGCAIGFAGVVIVNISAGSQGSITLAGEGFILFSAISYAVSSVLIKQFSKDENPVVLSGYQFAIGGFIMIVSGLLFGGRLSLISIKGILMLLYLAFLSAAAYTLWGILLKYNDVSRIAVFGFMTPIFGCVFSVLFLSESFGDSGLKTILSLILVSFGIIIVNKKTKVI